jgi:hypothetical protein
MSLQDILNALADKTPFVTEAERDGIKAKIANLGKDSEGSETAEVATSGNEPGVAEEAKSTEAIGTTVPAAPETPPATEVGMGIVPEPAANVEADNSGAEAPAPAAPATDPSMGIITGTEPEAVEPATEAHGGTSVGETPDTKPVEENPTEAPATESGSGSEAGNVGS